MRCDLIQGDCLEKMKQIEACSVDAVITDPPYMIGAISIGNPSAKSGTWADMENAAFWFSAWYAECWRKLKSTGYLLTFGNWRSIPTMLYALSKAGIPASSCLVWDKDWIGPSAPNQLRPTYEIVMFSARPDAAIDNRSAEDLYLCKWQAANNKTTEHPAEKPVTLLEHLIGLVTKPGDTVLDPFMGSGTTGVACHKTGRGFIGIERSEDYFQIARNRIQAAQRIQELPLDFSEVPA